jgi:uncharacterized membrane protein YozB (DUF420 family)
MTVHDLPALNATLNATSALLLLSGWVGIRRRNIAVHRALMVAALVTSTAFLVSYLVYHAQVGSVRYQGQGWIRRLYFGILSTHTVLAAAIVPLVIITARRAIRRDFVRHRAIARWTLPLWMYVSVTGVVIYYMLYRWI